MDLDYGAEGEANNARAWTPVIADADRKEASDRFATWQQDARLLAARTSARRESVLSAYLSAVYPWRRAQTGQEEGKLVTDTHERRLA